MFATGARTFQSVGSYSNQPLTGLPDALLLIRPNGTAGDQEQEHDQDQEEEPNGDDRLVGGRGHPVASTVTRSGCNRAIDVVTSKCCTQW
jgi:hypothetical protein